MALLAPEGAGLAQSLFALVALVCLFVPDFELLGAQLPRQIRGAVARVGAGTLGPLVDLDYVVPLVSAVLNAVLAEELALAHLAELAATQAHVVIEVPIVGVEAGTHTCLLLYVLLLIYGLETESVSLLTFDLVGGRFRFGGLGQLFDEGHQIFGVVADNVDFEPLETLEGAVNFVIELLLLHAAVIAYLEYLEWPLKKLSDLTHSLEYLGLADARVVQLQLERANQPEIRQRGDDVGDVLDGVPGQI